VTHGRRQFWKHTVAVNLTAFYAWCIQCKQLTSYKTVQLPLRSTTVVVGCSGLRRGVALATVLLSFPTTYSLRGAVSWHRRTQDMYRKYVTANWPAALREVVSTSNYDVVHIYSHISLSRMGDEQNRRATASFTDPASNGAIKENDHNNELDTAQWFNISDEHDKYQFEMVSKVYNCVLCITCGYKVYCVLTF